MFKLRAKFRLTEENGQNAYLASPVYKVVFLAACNTVFSDLDFLRYFSFSDHRNGGLQFLCIKYMMTSTATAGLLRLCLFMVLFDLLIMCRICSGYYQIRFHHRLRAVRSDRTNHFDQLRFSASLLNPKSRCPKTSMGVFVCEIYGASFF